MKADDKPSAVVLIGGLDTSGGAGLAADLRVAAALRTPAMPLISAVAIQNAAGLSQVFPIPEGVFGQQLAAIDWDKVGAVKLGMLYLPEFFRLILGAIPPSVPLVIDPLLSTSLGGRLALAELVEVLRTNLARATLFTLNREESQALFNQDYTTEEEAVKLAAELSRRYQTAVLLKGGHLPGEPVDILAVDDELTRFTGERAAASPRGTGCALATAIACHLSRGASIVEAVTAARELINHAVKHAYLSPAGMILDFS